MDCRDKALLTVTFFGGFRRSEVVSLDLEHIKFTDKGAEATLLQSKTSDTAEIVYLAYARKDKDICPVALLKTWLNKAKITEGAIFRSFMKGDKVSGRLSGHSVSQILKNHFGEEYSGHSTRRGLLTDAAEKNTPIHIMKKLSRHKSAEMILRYAEAAQGFEDSAVSVLGI
jgi:integrase